MKTVQKTAKIIPSSRKGMLDGGGVGGTFYAAAAAAMAFVAAGLIISYSSSVTQSIGTGFNSNASLGSTAAYAANNNVTAGLGTFASNLPTMASVGVAVLIIGLLIYGFSGLFNKKGE